MRFYRIFIVSFASTACVAKVAKTRFDDHPTIFTSVRAAKSRYLYLVPAVKGSKAI